EPLGPLQVDGLQQEDAENEREVAEEAVVRGRDVHELEAGEYEEGDEPPEPRPEDRERHQELEGEGGAALERVEPGRRVVRVPGEARGERRGLVVVEHGAAVLPVPEM